MILHDPAYLTKKYLTQHSIHSNTRYICIWYIISTTIIYMENFVLFPKYINIGNMIAVFTHGSTTFLH